MAHVYGIFNVRSLSPEAEWRLCPWSQILCTCTCTSYESYVTMNMLSIISSAPVGVTIFHLLPTDRDHKPTAGINYSRYVSCVQIKQSSQSNQALKPGRGRYSCHIYAQWNVMTSSYLFPNVNELYALVKTLNKTKQRYLLDYHNTDC